MKMVEVSASVWVNPQLVSSVFIDLAPQEVATVRMTNQQEHTCAQAADETARQCAERVIRMIEEAR